MKMFIASILGLLVIASVTVIGSAEHHHPAPAYEHQSPPIPIVHSESYSSHDGSYKFAYESGNGIAAQEEGFVKNAGNKDHEVQVAHGSYSYTDPHGVPVSISYVADENGFQAKGSHIPTPPPVPQELIDAYAKAASQPQHHDAEPEYAQPPQHGYSAY
ncbi:cuticular protein 32, RR-1 family [Anopheles darlingi]|uniref:Cuticular protein 32, RR-1 family n=1 Tax=Anopheles darlingi TaxID=43151 RepID=W5J635_ANODA|nr:endocuticle structural glycoprotein SgAbd-2-like [Anopheles darlingi]ETN59441.1 cuticular protein 32, RR-1 family [Anopheles darlingi]